jgi:hypothetical protein
MQATFTAKQAAELSGLPYPTLSFLRARGIVTPSVRVGGNKGAANVYSFADLVALRSLCELRATPATFDALSSVAKFWKEERARALIVAAERTAGSPSAQILVITSTGRIALEADATVLALARKYESSVLHIVDVARLVMGVLVDATQHRLMRLHREPGASGREPPEIEWKPRRQGKREEGGSGKERPEAAREISPRKRPKSESKSQHKKAAHPGTTKKRKS